jgi:hypothetical protein
MKTALNQKFAAALVATLALTITLRAQQAVTNVTITTTETTTSTPMGIPGATNPDPWRFDFSIIGWGPSINGDVTVHGHQATVDESARDLLDDLKGIAMLGFEVRKEKFGFYAQPNWIKLETDASVGPLEGTFESELWIVDAAGFYQIHKWGEERPLTLDALAGVRYWHIKNELRVNGSGGVVNFDSSDSNYLIDPIVGLRAKMYFTRKFSVSLHGDVGGFDASDHSSDLSWQAVGTLEYDFCRTFSLSLGYRALSVDKGSGSGSDVRGMNAILHGPLLALNFHW